MINLEKESKNHIKTLSTEIGNEEKITFFQQVYIDVENFEKSIKEIDFKEKFVDFKKIFNDYSESIVKNDKSVYYNEKNNLEFFLDQYSIMEL